MVRCGDEVSSVLLTRAGLDATGSTELGREEAMGSFTRGTITLLSGTVVVSQWCAITLISGAVNKVVPNYIN